MIEVVRSSEFDEWIRALRDQRARAKVQARILRLALGNPGDVRPVGEGISEMRIDYGPGYRLYFVAIGKKLVVLLCGGDKTSQQRDIDSAKAIAKRWKE
jgi:putative addiction module killer protein